MSPRLSGRPRISARPGSLQAERSSGNPTRMPSVNSTLNRASSARPATRFWSARTSMAPDRPSPRRNPAVRNRTAVESTERFANPETRTEASSTQANTSTRSMTGPSGRSAGRAYQGRSSVWSDGGAHEHVEELADGSLSLEVVGDRQVVLNVVSVPSPVARLHEIPGRGEVGHDLVGGSFGDAEFAGDIDQTDIWSTGEEHQESPRFGRGVLNRASWWWRRRPLPRFPSS